jgi:Transcription factor regulating root and shoot growth via Pin3
VTNHSVMPTCNGGPPHASTSEEYYSQHNSHDFQSNGVPDASACSDHQPLSCKCNKVIIKEEVVEQVEPGVYITITFSRIGDKNLKRIRFRYVKHLGTVYK